VFPSSEVFTAFVITYNSIEQEKIDIIMPKESMKGRSKQRHFSSLSPSLLPSEIVCTTSDLTSSKSSMECAVILSLIVVILYAYVSFEAMLALPDVPTGFQMGVNLNVARLESDATLLVRQRSMTEAHGTINRKQQQQKNNDGNKATQQKDAKSPTHAAAFVPDKAATQGETIEPPEGQWPVTLGDELDDYEDLLHVGDMKTVLKVPKFWAPPLHNKQFYTRKQAMKVGTCIEADPTTGSHVRGDECPLDQRTIYIGLASYRDFQCRYTLESAFLRAKHPERIRVGA
jgi:hypothetical protein